MAKAAKKSKAKKSKAKKAKTSRRPQSRRDQQKPTTRSDPKAAGDAVKAMAQAAVTDAPPPPPFAALVRAINARFARALPPAAASSGAHEPETPVEARGVPDGIFRIDGSDWLMHVKNGIVHLFEKAHADLDPKHVVAVPSHA